MAIKIDDVSDLIWLRDGCTVYDSRLTRILNYNELNRLLSCVEDNIFDTDEGESIDFVLALRDFNQKEQADVKI